MSTRRRTFTRNKGADGIYIQGGAWHTESVVELLEQDLQVPVVHANIAPAWEILKRLSVREPRTGFGRLLRELPEMP
jgi:maleate isomerase